MLLLTVFFFLNNNHVRYVFIELSNRINKDVKDLPKLRKKRQSENVAPRVKRMKIILENLSERKVQLAISAYDVIDQYIGVVEEEIRLLDLAIALNSQNSGDPDKSSELSASQFKIGPFSTSSEPVYCTCHQIAHGEMVQCDNEECKIEWFHMACVGLKKPPVKAWFCPECKKQR